MTEVPLPDVTIAAPPPPPPTTEGGGGDADEEEGFGASDVLLDSVTKDEWKLIEQSLSYQKKTVAEMLKKVCSRI